MDVEYRVWHADDVIWDGKYPDEPSGYREAMYYTRAVIDLQKEIGAGECSETCYRIQICQDGIDVTGSYGIGWE